VVATNSLTLGNSISSGPDHAGVPGPLLPHHTPPTAEPERELLYSRPLSRTTHYLVEQLQRPYTCTSEEHSTRLRVHLHRVKHHRHMRRECSSLAEIRDLVDPTLPTNAYIPHVLQEPGLRRAGKPEVLHPSDLEDLSDALNSKVILADSRFSRLFEGRDHPSAKPYNVCLHLNETSRLGQEPVETCDVDSICSFVSDLAVCRRGLTWLTKPVRVTNILNRVHGVSISITAVDGTGRAKRVAMSIDKIPHLCLGHLVGAISINLYIFFPRIYSSRTADNRLFTNFLTDDEERLWVDGVFLPALVQSVPYHKLQELPLSWAAASAESLARGLEDTAFDQPDKGTTTRQQLLGKVIQPQYLRSLWRNIQRQIQENERFAQFRDAQLFLNGKDFKDHTSSLGWRELRESWSALWSEIVDPEYYDRARCWFDIGRQITPSESLLVQPPDALRQEPESFSWKMCCLEGYYRHRLGDQPRAHLRNHVYRLGTLRDTGAMILTPSDHSQEHREGLIYSQFYFKGKRHFVTSKVQTFGNEKLEMLALDPDYISSLVTRSGGGTVGSLKSLVTSYLRSKDRAHQNLVNASNISSGIREEHRISGELWEGVMNELTRGAPGQVSAELPYYTIPSETLYGFLRGQVNKFCLGFELILSQMASNYTRWEETQVATIFLRALRYSFSTSPVQQERLLWDNEWHSRGQLHYGFNMGHLSQRTGLGWFDSRLDWTRWRLKVLFADHMLLENPRILRHYSQRWGTLRGERDIYLILQQVARWLEACRTSPKAIQVVLDYLTGLCLSQFRRDVFQSLVTSGAVKEDVIQAAVRGELYLCHKTLREVLNDGEPWLVTGNKSSIKDPMHLVDYLFDSEPFVIAKSSKVKQRLHWDSLTYRALYHKAIVVLSKEIGDTRAREWQQSFKIAVLALNYILPYPDYNTFFSRTKLRAGLGQDKAVKTRRCWMAVWTQPRGIGDRLRGTRQAPWQIWNLLEWFYPLQYSTAPPFGVGRVTPERATIEPGVPVLTHFDKYWHGLSGVELDSAISPLLGATDTDGQERRQQELSFQPRPAVLYPTLAVVIQQKTG
jgi:hypothetical protein